MIAMAIANDPDIILADEPTTALDVTVQAQILDVLRTAQRETGAALVLVSHDLGVIAGIADRVAVMYAGRMVETAGVDELFARPRMPYTVGLLGALPRLDEAGAERSALVPIPGRPPTPAEMRPGLPVRRPLPAGRRRVPAEPMNRPFWTVAACHRCRRTRSGVPAADRRTRRTGRPGPMPPTVLHVEGLAKTYPLLAGNVFKRRVGSVHAVDGVDLDIRRGETLATGGGVRLRQVHHAAGDPRVGSRPSPARSNCSAAPWTGR